MLTKRMQQIRNDIQFRIIVSLNKRLDEISSPSSETLATHRKVLENHMLRDFRLDGTLSPGLESRLDDLNGVLDRNAELAMLMHQETLSAVRSMPGTTPVGLFPAPPWQYQPHWMIEDNAHTPLKTRAVLDRLRFTKMANRHEEIAVAHKSTFRWIFLPEDPSKPKPWTNFRSWLSQGGGIYWLSGKAASGKSTLMKYIDDHETLREILSSWANGNDLVVASYYFWHSGTAMQRTLTGMMQTLLCQILEQRNDLISTAFPDLEFDTFLSRARPLTLPELEAALERLVRNGSKCGLKMCFLIDGLDEFDGGDAEMADLANHLASMVESSHIKIVVSSRPLAVFEDAFVDCAKLRLQDLTKDDITAYVDQNVNQNKRMMELKTKSPQEASKLVSDIVNKASGVFLWVKLVVRSLLEGLRNFDNIDDLQERLQELPSDLEELYRYMLQKISPRYQAQAARLIELVRKDATVHDRPISTLSLSFADDKNSDYAIASLVRPLTKEEKFQRCREMDRKLRSRTAGLLEVQHKLCNLQDAESADPQSKEYIYLIESHVQFLHKSVTDFLDTLEPTDVLLSNHDSSCSSSVALLRAYMMQLKTTERASTLNQDYWRTLHSAVTFARKADLAEQQDETDLLNQIDIVISHHADVTINPCKTHWSELDPGYGYRTRDHHDNFLSFCIQSGLLHYARAAFSTYGAGLLRKDGRPLLDYVLCPWQRLEAPVLLCNAEIVELLVTHGASVTDRFEGETLYHRYVQHLLATEILSLDQFKRSIRIFRILFDAGLNVKATFKSEVDIFSGQKQQRTYSVLRIIRMVFLERESSPSTEGLMPQIWMSKVAVDDEAVAAAKALETCALARGAKDREWRDGVLVVLPSSNRLKVELSKFKGAWKRKSA